MGDNMEMESRLPEIMNDRGMTQAHLVRRTGANKTTINNIVKYGQIPKLPLAYKIAKELNLHIEDIWFIKENKNEQL
ncbi:helix-turn-helix domain-containing protein [Ornithinibacillus sp. JPR2-1]|uniref:helix-turn-helix transcriptional regulator n=1 Tax=Ornithinibacillus sp. JPR2-1 TaxID=2094019 RepID=UPI0031D8F096